jgi:hypothetical protein
MIRWVAEALRYLLMSSTGGASRTLPTVTISSDGCGSGDGEYNVNNTGISQ